MSNKTKGVKKVKLKILLFGLILLVAVACSKEQETLMDEEIINPPLENLGDMPKAPPNLKVVIDGFQVSTILGARSWSYFDEEENAMALVEAESLSPLELAGNQQAPSVNTSSVIRLNFEEEPESYEVHIWDSIDHIKGPFNEIVLTESAGKTVYEVTAVWGQGTARYVFALVIE